MPDSTKPYCGVVALSSVTGRNITDIQARVNANRKAPPDAKIVGMKVKELFGTIRDNGMDYRIEELNTPFTKYRPESGTKLVILDKYRDQDPHIVVTNKEYYIDSDNPRKTARDAYKYPFRPIRAVIHLTRNGKDIEDFFEVKQ